jgi:mannose/fructose/N-acetylgalactosamine-specific phosphotransferase system component IIB
MNVQLFRIDDRLIHGQVVLGWASHLGSKEIILCDDSVSENAWEKELYLSVVPDQIKARVTSVDEMTEFLKTDNDLSNSIIVVSSPFTIESLLKEDINLPEINIGGIHFKDGRIKYLPYLYLNEEEVSSFQRCIEKGIHFNCQDMPEAKKSPLDHILNHN